MTACVEVGGERRGVCASTEEAAASAGRAAQAPLLQCQRFRRPLHALPLLRLRPRLCPPHPRLGRPVFAVREWQLHARPRARPGGSEWTRSVRRARARQRPPPPTAWRAARGWRLPIRVGRARRARQCHVGWYKGSGSPGKCEVCAPAGGVTCDVASPPRTRHTATTSLSCARPQLSHLHAPRLALMLDLAGATVDSECATREVTLFRC